VLDLVHALADAHGSRQVTNDIDAAESLPQLVAVAYIADDELGVGGEIVRSLGPWMDLGIQAVEDADLVSGVQKLFREVRSDKAGAPDDEYSL
jgi:hypothetical protein